MTKRISTVKPSLVTTPSGRNFELVPADTRTHYGEHGFERGGQSYAFLTRKASECYMVRSRWDGKVLGFVARHSDEEWGFSKVNTHEQTPRWLAYRMGDLPETIYNLESRIRYSSKVLLDCLEQV